MTRTYLTATQEQKLLESACVGDINARNLVIMNVYNLIHFKVSKHLHYSDCDREDAVQFVVSVLCEKFYKFDSTRKLRYMTYANYWIRLALQQYMQRRKLIPFRDKSPKILSMEPVNHDEEQYFQEFICTRELSPENQLEETEALAELNRVLNMLTPRQRDILLRRSCGEKLRGIAQTIGVTKERIRQIEKEAIQQLRDCFKA